MSYITGIGTANPKNRFSQSVLADFIIQIMQLGSADERKLKTIFKASGIEHRHFILEDYTRASDFSFYPEEKGASHPSTHARLEIFKNNALQLSVDAIGNLKKSNPFFEPNKITHLITVSCTGMYAPGLDIELIKEVNLPTTVKRTSITFMGCYAAFNALKVADAFCHRNEDAKVLIVCTELCSIHLQPQATEHNIIANALFADGAAAALVGKVPSAPLRLKLENFHSDLAMEGDSDMSWNIGDLGFEMRLSGNVPEIIKRGIAKLTRCLLEKVEKEFSDVKHFAIHPGGRKILEVIEQELGISKEDNRSAYHVLKNYGNMSSPTVLFVIQDLLNHLTSQNHNERIISFAFGPGLTLESMILKIESV